MISDKECDGFTIDQWIDLFKKNLEEASTEEDIAKYNKALEILVDIKKSNSILSPGDDIKDDIFIYIKMISDAFYNIFNSWEYTARRIDNIIVIYNDVVSIDLYMDNGNVWCFVSFGYNTKPPLVAEITKTLCDIFDVRIGISNDVYYINELNDEFIWGEDNIRNYINSKKGYIKANPVIIFDDETRGNC